MNRKFLIPFAIAAIIGIILLFIDGEKHGNKYEMTIPDIATEASVKNIKAVNLFIDYSGSMQGYVNFSGNNPAFANAQKSMISTLTTFMNNIYSTYNIESQANCGGAQYTRANFNTSLQDNSIFRGATTELAPIIATAGASASDTSVSVVITDMVLSYGKSKLIAQNDMDYNKHALQNLGADIHTAMTNIKKRDLDVMVVKYESDFNGNFYYNYSENLREGSCYQNQLMKRRPYYLLFIGKEKSLRSIAANKCFDVDKDTKTYATFEIEKKTTQGFEISQAPDHPWVIGDEAGDQEKSVSVWSSGLGDVEGIFKFQCKPIDIPYYVSQKLTVKWDEGYIKSVTSNDDYSSFNVTLRPFKELHNGETWFSLVSSYSWFSECTLENDVKQNLTEMEGKTWALSTVLDNITKAYGRSEMQEEEVARFPFSFMKE